MDTSPVVPESAPRKRRRFSPEQIQSYLDEFSQSQLSAAEFCREHQLGYGTFQRWRQCRSAQAKGAPQFE
jgi:transposase-like protein